MLLSPESSSPTTSAPSRRAVVAVGVIVVGHLLLAWLMRIPGLAWGEDDAAYIQLADQLRQLSFREVHDIAQPFHARFPPGYPLSIALVRSLGAESIGALTTTLAIMTTLSIVFLFDAVRRRFDEWVGVLSALLFAACPTTFFESSHVMAEAQFVLFTMLGVWALSREHEGRVFSIVGGGAIIAAALTRSAGVVFLPTLFLYWLLRRKWRHALWFSVASLPVVAWIGWTFLAPDALDRRLYTAQIGLRGEDASASASIARTLRRLPMRLEILLRDHVPTALGVYTVRGTLVDNAAWLGLIVGFGATGVLVWWRRWRIASLIAVAYVGLLIVYRHSIPRFVYPLVPLIFAAIFVGIGWWVRRLGWAERYGRLAMLVVTLAFLAGHVTLNAPVLEARLACDRRNPLQSPSCLSDDERAYLQLARWARDSTPRSAVFLASKERALYFHSGRRTINNDRALREDSASIGAYARQQGVTHAAVVRVGVFEVQHNDLIARGCREFDLVRTFGDERALLLRLREQPATEFTPTCQALQPWRRPDRRR